VVSFDFGDLVEQSGVASSVAVRVGVSVEASLGSGARLAA